MRSSLIYLLLVLRRWLSGDNRANIKRLLSGTENKFGQKAKVNNSFDYNNYIKYEA